jgi:hypothetical protein
MDDRPRVRSTNEPPSSDHVKNFRIGLLLLGLIALLGVLYATHRLAG